MEIRKKKILIIENQYTQFKEIIKLLPEAEYEYFPDDAEFKKYIDWIRIYLNRRYNDKRRKECWEKILKKTNEYNSDLIIIDHILVGTHDAKDGIDLAIDFREADIKQPFIFFSRTDINNIDICDRLPKVSLNNEWMSKGYSGKDILDEDIFAKRVIAKIEELTGQFSSCFISHSSRDTEFAEKLHRDLQKKGIVCWYSPESLKIGDFFRDKIEEAIDENDKLILVMSKNSINSKWVRDEIETALDKEGNSKKPFVLPILIEEIEGKTVDTINESTFKSIKRARHIGDFTEWKDKETYKQILNKLIEAIKE